MNKIFNWTIGSVFRTLGRIFAYLLVGVLLGLFMQKNNLKITDLLGIDTIKAAEVSPLEVKKFYVADVTDSIINPDQQWSSAIDWGTEYNRTSETSLFLRSVRVRAGFSSKFLKGVTYKFRINVIFSNSTNGQFYKLPDNIICQGSGTSSWSSDIDLLSSCKFIGREFYNNKANASYIFEFVPSADIYGVQIAWYYKLPVYGNYDMYFANVGKIRVLNSSKITYDNSTNDAINSMSDNITINQNKNTEQIINNNNQNTQDIINNQNEMLGNKCPNLLDKSQLKDSTTINGITYTNNGNGTFNIHGTATANTGLLLYSTNYIGSIIKKNENVGIYSSVPYNSQNFNLSVRYTTNNSTVYLTPNNSPRVLPNDTQITYGLNLYIENGQTVNKDNVKILIYKDKVYNNWCEYGTYQSKLDSTNQSINDLNDSINDDNTSGATSSAGGFFSSFNTDTHGLTGIITAPLTAINRLTSTNCSPLVLPLPFVNQNLTLPCMRPIYTSNFGSFMDLYDVIVIGIISYWILVRIFALVKDFKNPEHDEIEVMDL